MASPKQKDQRSRKGEFTTLEKSPRKANTQRKSYTIPQSLVDAFLTSTGKHDSRKKN